MNKRNYRITNSAKILIIEIIISMAGIFSGFTWNLYTKNKEWDKLIYPSISVSGIYLGGKTAEQGKKLLEEQVVSPVLSKNLEIDVDGKTFTLYRSKLISDNNIDSVVSEAFSYGKNLNPFGKYRVINYPELNREYKIDYSFNENYIKDLIKNICNEVNRSPSNASINYTNDGTLQIIDDKNGVKVDEADLESEIKKRLLTANKSDSDNIIKAKIIELPAEIRRDILSKMNTKISSFSTNYAHSSSGRAHNIELAANSINGKIIMPGETFSFNGTVGERTANRGYMEAPVIVGFSIDSGLGGGICQVSSTLYNAVLRSGLGSEERVRHSIPSDYVPLGLDATVDWNNIDYKFKNTLSYPIYLQSFTENSTLYVNIYSDSSLSKKEYRIWNEVYETIQSDIEIIDNPNMEEGETAVTQKGYEGYKVKVHRDTYENDMHTSDEIISDDFYPPIPKIINRGIKAIK